MARPTDIELTYTKDYRGQDCLIVRKEKGKKLTVPAVLEAMDRQDVYGAWYMPIVFNGEIGDDAYDPGDCWALYDADTINEKLAEDQFDAGYQAGQKDAESYWKDLARRNGWRLP